MKKVRFSIIDVVIVLVVAAALAVCAKVVLPGSVAVGDKSNVGFTVLATKTDSGISELINVGEDVRISFAEQAYATVLDISEEPCREWEYFMPESRYKQNTIEGKSDIKVRLSCEADITDTGISANNVPIRIGESVIVHGKGCTLQGYIVEIDDGKGDN